MTTAITIKFLGDGIRSMKLVNGKSEKIALTNQDILDAKKMLPFFINRTSEYIKPYILKGGFQYVPSLWKFSHSYDKYNFNVYVTIKFEDLSGRGKKWLTDKIRRTGLLEFDHTIL